jgi:gas vesicle protein
MQDNSSKALWFVAGVAMGATIALLFAPASGEQTRRAIGRQASRGRESIADASRDALELGKEYMEKGRHLADEAADLFERGKKLVEG